jgi:hypothetical protein
MVIDDERTQDASERLRVLAKQLRAMGVWNHLPVEERDVREASYANDELIPAPVENEEGILCDGEELDEGDVDGFLEEAATELRERAGFELPAFRLVDEGVRIGEDYFVIWPDEEQDWYRTTVRTLGALNFVLARAESPFRLVVAYAGGNEAIALVMREEVARAVNESGAWEPKEELEVPPPLAPN